MLAEANIQLVKVKVTLICIERLHENHERL